MTIIEPVRFEHGRPMRLGGLRRRHTFAESARTIPRQWQEFESMLPLPAQLGTTNDSRFDPRTGKGGVEIWIAIADDARAGGI